MAANIGLMDCVLQWLYYSGDKHDPGNRTCLITDLMQLVKNLKEKYPSIQYTQRSGKGEKWDLTSIHRFKQQLSKVIEDVNKLNTFITNAQYSIEYFGQNEDILVLTIDIDSLGMKTIYSPQNRNIYTENVVYLTSSDNMIILDILTRYRDMEPDDFS